MELNTLVLSGFKIAVPLSLTAIYHRRIMKTESIHISLRRTLPIIFFISSFSLVNLLEIGYRYRDSRER